MVDQLIGSRATESSHSTLQFALKVPSIGSVNDILQLGLTGKELVHLVRILVILRKTELHVNLLILSKGIYCRLYTLLHALHNGLAVLKLWLLWQITHSIAWRPYHVTLIVIVKTRDNLHEGRLTRTVHTHDTDLRSIEERKIDILQHLLVCLFDGLAKADHRKDDFLVVNCCHKNIF